MTILTPKGYSSARRSSSERPAEPQQAPAAAPPEQAAQAQPQIKLAFPPQVTGVNCPSCGTPYPVQLFNIVDVGQDPVLKSLLLSGQLNIAVCPRCNAGGAIGTPFLYHDPEHEFLGVYVPEQLAVNEQQKVIGQLSKRLVDGLPQESRRGYMLTPRQFLTYQGLLEAILENEGITREMMDRQRRRLSLMEQALTALDDPEGLHKLVKESDDEMDDEFFGLLHSITQGAGSAEEASAMTTLRERLIELTTWGEGVKRQRAAIAKVRPDTTPQQLAELVIATDDLRVVDALVVAANPLVTYPFYQELASRIEAAERQGDAGEAERLTDLRQHILEFSDQLEQMKRAEAQEAAQVLSDILASNDIAQAVAERADQIDQNFLALLAANLQQAESKGASAAVRRLEEVWNQAMALIQEAAPPAVRLVNELIQAQYPGETRQILARNRELVDAELVAALQELAEQMEAEGDREVAKRLRQIHSQAQLMR